MTTHGPAGCPGRVTFGCCVQGTLGSARVLREKATRGSQNTTGNLRQTLGLVGREGNLWMALVQSGARTQGPGY